MGRKEVLGNIPEEETSELLPAELDWWRDFLGDEGAKHSPCNDVPSMPPHKTPEDPKGAHLFGRTSDAGLSPVGAVPLAASATWEGVGQVWNSTSRGSPRAQGLQWQGHTLLWSPSGPNTGLMHRSPSLCSNGGGGGIGEDSEALYGLSD